MTQSGISSDRNKKIIAVLKLILLAAILAGIPAFLYLKFGSEIFSSGTVNRVTSYLRLNQSIAWLLIIGLQILQVVICVIPGQPIQFASSYMFGVFTGFILSLTGAVLGTAISFYLAKLLGSDALHLFFDDEKLKDYQGKLNSGRGLLLAFLIYLIPGFPKDIVSYAAGISEMRFWPFLLVSSIGRSPGMLGSLLFGHFLGKGNYRAIIILSAIVAVILIICLVKRESLMRLLDDIEDKAIVREENRKSKKEKTNG